MQQTTRHCATLTALLGLLTLACSPNDMSTSGEVDGAASQKPRCGWHTAGGLASHPLDQSTHVIQTRRADGAGTPLQDDGKWSL